MYKSKSYLFLLLMLIASILVGCVVATPSPTANKKPSVPIQGDLYPTETTLDDAATTQVNIQYLPETVDNPDGLPVLKWLCLETIRDNFQEFSQDTAMEINRVLAEKELPFRLQFVLYSTDSLEPTDWLSMPAIQEALAEADLVYGKFSEDQAMQYLLPLTDYVTGNAEPSLVKAVPHEKYWSLVAYGEEIYCVPASLSVPLGHGFCVNSEVFTDWGFETDDFTVPYWEMDELFAQIYVKNENKPFLYDSVGEYKILTDPNTGEKYDVGNVSVMSSGNCYFPTSFYKGIMNHYQQVSSCFAIDFSSGTPTVVNYLETDYVRLSQAAMYRYRKAGYLTTSEGAALVDTVLAYSNHTYHNDDEGTVIIPSEVFTLSAATAFNGITVTSEYQQQALTLLSLMAEDEAFRELLLFGVEGQDYSLTETGSHTTIAKMDDSYYNMSFLSAYSSLYGTGSDYLIPTQTGSTRLETYQATMDHIHILCDIVFDHSAVETELEAVNAILTRLEREDFEEDPPIQFAIFGNLTEEEYDQMLTEIRAVGGDKIQAELQRQLDKWLAENPDWNK